MMQKVKTKRCILLLNKFYLLFIVGKKKKTIYKPKYANFNAKM